ncbi:MAG TPA: efflux RND transporter periplasmic adaptor subunit [Lacipirellulaceae bacterium]|nr:efflux RND transporter periplasmic adaptor subunit [Lacipirellulaceae bacterium]
MSTATPPAKPNDGSPGGPAPAAPASRAPLRELSALKIDRSRQRGASMGVKLLWLAVLLALVAALGGGLYWALYDRLFPLPVVTVDSVRVMTLGQARTEHTATGYLESRWQAAVGAKVPGRIAQIPVEEGDVVQAGDVLAELEHSDLDAMLASRRVAVISAEAQLAEAEFNLAQALRTLNRERELNRRGVGTDAALELAETAYNAAQAVLNARVAAVDAAKCAVLEGEEAVKNMFIYAPFAGTVVTKDAEKGESIMPGGMGASSGRGSVITLAKLDELEVDTDVKEDYLGMLRKGQPAQIAVDAVTDRRYKGRLREIIPMGDRTRGIVKVKVSVLDPDERLFPELSATVHFLPDERNAGDSEADQQKGTFIPAAAIQGTGEDQYAWVVENGRVRKATVESAGEPDDGLVPVAGGLQGGDQVVTNPPADLKENDEVRIAE